MNSAGNWSVVPSANFGTSYNYLYAIKCLSGSRCFAVGYTFNSGDGRDYALLEEWNGTSWTVVEPTGPLGNLSDVTCSSATECWSVGYLLGMSATTLIQRWNGNAWSVISSPNASGVDESMLRGVACGAVQDCWAVGYSFNHTGGSVSTLIEHWNGSAWSIVISPNAIPSGGGSLWENRLMNVTCSSMTDCWAVGFAAMGTQQTLVEHWNGTNWQIVPSPNTSSAQNNYLYGVACSSAVDCWAVGNYVNSNGVLQTLVIHWNGSSWSLTGSPNSSVVHNNMLFGVACSSASRCWASGYYIDANNIHHGLLLRWDGASWSVASSPADDISQSNELWGISCVSNYNCWAVGNYKSNTNVTQAFVLHYTESPVMIASVVRLENGHIYLAGQAMPNTLLSLDVSASFGSPFVSIDNATAAADGTFHFEDADLEGVQQRFYRVSIP